MILCLVMYTYVRTYVCTLYGNVSHMYTRSTYNTYVIVIQVCMTVMTIISERASSVMLVFNRDLRYVHICGRTSTSMHMPKKVLLRNGLSN